MSTDYATRDEFADEDDEFLRAHDVIARDLKTPLDSRTVEDAALSLARLALHSGDRIMLSFFLARLDDYGRAGRPAPLLMQQAVTQAFERFQRGASMDEAFGLKQERRGRKSDLRKRLWARFNAAHVSAELDKGASLEIAIENVSKFRRRSESQIKRDYLRYRRRIKSE